MIIKSIDRRMRKCWGIYRGRGCGCKNCNRGDRSICPTYYLIATQLIAGGTSLIQLIVASLTIVLSPRDYKSKWRSYLYINNYTDWSARYCSIWKSWQRSI